MLKWNWGYTFRNCMIDKKYIILLHKSNHIAKKSGKLSCDVWKDLFGLFYATRANWNLVKANINILGYECLTR